MKYTVINENERGLLFKNGRYKGLLSPGKYCNFSGRYIEVLDLKKHLLSDKISLDELMDKDEIKNLYEVREVLENHLLLRYIDGRLYGTYPCDKYAFYKGIKGQELVDCDMSKVKIEGLSVSTINQIPTRYYSVYNVSPYERGLLFIDNKFVEMLEGGTYYFWKGVCDVKVVVLDARLLNMNISSQELLTQDKVNVRISLNVCYRIKDFYKSYTEVDNFEEQLRLCAQLALRDYIGQYKLDEILDKKDEISKFVEGKLKEKECELYVEIKEAGVKDIILPGEIRTIMNTILMAEKKAQANVITRREEVASTRSLLNTAKLMEENQTLYKLKELEYLERICENVGNITLNGNGDVLGQLAALLKGGK